MIGGRSSPSERVKGRPDALTMLGPMIFLVVVDSGNCRSRAVHRVRRGKAYARIDQVESTMFHAGLARGVVFVIAGRGRAPAGLIHVHPHAAGEAGRPSVVRHPGRVQVARLAPDMRRQGCSATPSRVMRPADAELLEPLLGGLEGDGGGVDAAEDDAGRPSWARGPPHAALVDGRSGSAGAPAPQHQCDRSHLSGRRS